MPKSKRFYVYVHKDIHGNIFYVGKGSGRRAWSKSRDEIWRKYVDRIGGNYEVEIIQSDLTEQRALDKEWSLISQIGEQLVNWQNPGRGFDYDNISTFHKERDANRRFIEETKRNIEPIDLSRAVEYYLQAWDCMRRYESLVRETGLVAELTPKFKNGDPEIIDRISLCLLRLKRFEELISVTNCYFDEFPDARPMSKGKVALARAAKAKRQIESWTNS